MCHREMVCGVYLLAVPKEEHLSQPHVRQTDDNIIDPTIDWLCSLLIDIQTTDKSE